MAYKVFTRGNYLIMQDSVTNKEYEGLRKDVRVRRDLLSSETFYFDNVNGLPNSGDAIALTDLRNSENATFTLEEWITFYSSATGNFNGAGVSPTFVEQIDFTDINENIENGTIVLRVRSFYGFSVDEIFCKSDSGTADITISLDGSPITGLTAVSVTDGGDTYTATADNIATESTKVLLTIANATSLNGLSISIKGTRT